jgi:hypothetical protein
MQTDHTFFWMAISISILFAIAGMFFVIGLQLAKENSDLRVRLGREEKYVAIPLKYRLLNYSARYVYLLYPTYVMMKHHIRVYRIKLQFIYSWIKQINYLWRIE